MTRPLRRNPPARRTHGFSLIELLVVVGIILLLVGAGTVSYRSIAGAARDRETRSTLARLATIATEYQAETGRIVNHINHIPPLLGGENPYGLRNLADFRWNSDSFRFNDSEDATGSGSLGAGNRNEFIARSIERFVWATYQVPSVREMYEPMDDNAFTDDEDSFTGPDGNRYEEGSNRFLEVRDGWGNKIVYVAYVAHQGNPGDNPPGDGYDDDDFLPRRDRPYFASPGRSGRFGSAAPNASDAQRQDAEDNIYSFDLD